ncbi:MAG: type IV pilus modification PilV family protein [Halanaerobiales bacterium]
MSDCRGFTLIEVLVAVIILSISFTVLAEGFSLAIDTYSRNRDYNFAVRLAEDKLEEIAGERESMTSGDIERENGRVFDWWVEDRVFQDSRNLRKYTITVEWNEGRRSYSAERLVFREN